MLVYAQCLLEKGLVIPKHHIARRFRQVVGQFSLRERFDEEMKRMTRVAELVVPNNYSIQISRPQDIGKPALPPLVDATILYWSDRLVTVTGVERLEVGVMQEAGYRQSWALRFPTEDELDDLLRDGASRRPDPLGLGVPLSAAK